MRDRVTTFSELRIFSQNVNRNYGYMDSILSSDDYDIYNLLFIQEPPWRHVRAAPSSNSMEGEDVIGAPVSPAWGCIVRSSGLENPPRVAVWFNNRIKSLHPGYRRDIIDHRDVIILSLGLGADTVLLANVYSDAVHTAINLLHDKMLELPKLRFMCGDFNVRSDHWDPLGPAVNIHADRLEAVVDYLGLARSLPEQAGPTHFPYAEGLRPTVIDLMFVLDTEALAVRHSIEPEERGTSDHPPLIIILSAPGSQVPVTKWGIRKDSDEEASFLGDVASGLQALSMWRGSSIAEVDVIVSAISSVFSMAWASHAKESRLCKRSKGWWNRECSDAIACLDLWAALDGTYNAAEGRAVDLSFLDPLEPLPVRDLLRQKR